MRPGAGRGIRALSAIVAAALGLAALVSCAGEPPGPAPAPGSSHASETPAPAPDPPDPDEVRRQRATAIVEGLGTRERAASVIMAGAGGVDPAALGEFVLGNGLGGFIVMSENVPADPAALSAITAAIAPDPAYPALIAIDEEGGEVSRLPWDGYPGADQLRFLPAEDAHAAFAGRAALLAESGLNVNFGVVADVTADPGSFIYWRTLGDTPEEAAVRVAAAVSGEQGAGEHGAVASTLKHFPGHGAATGDSHFGVPSTDLDRDAWAASHALPFVAGIDAGAELLMFGHLSYVSVDPLPASLSPEWHRIAREDLGFTGVAVSDDLGMLLDSGLAEYQDLPSIVVTALAAGADLALLVRGSSPESIPAIIDAVAAAVDSGALDADRLRDAAERVAELRLRLGERAAG